MARSLLVPDLFFRHSFFVLLSKSVHNHLNILPAQRYYLILGSWSIFFKVSSQFLIRYEFECVIVPDTGWVLKTKSSDQIETLNVGSDCDMSLKYYGF